MSSVKSSSKYEAKDKDFIFKGKKLRLRQSTKSRAKTSFFKEKTKKQLSFHQSLKPSVKPSSKYEAKGEAFIF
jgi:hypothetical protein